MHGSWFVFLLMVHAGKGSLQGWIEREEEDTPTCEELREFWNVVSRSVKMSETTNEIPLMPYAAGGRIKQHNYPTSRNSIQDIFFEDRLPPPDPKELFSPSKEQHPQRPFYVLHPTRPDSPYGVFGRFSSSSEDEESSRFGQWRKSEQEVLSGTKKKAGSEMVHAPSWGLPEEVGMFGRFVDLEEGLPLISNRHHPSSAGPPPPNAQGRTWATEPRTRGQTPSQQDSVVISREPCNQVSNKHCISDEECECSGWSSLRCQRGKCRSHSPNKGQDNEFGYWHESALPTSKLGLFKRSQRKSIFM